MNSKWFLFAHGAGASSSSPWMRRFASLLESIGPVISFDYSYMESGKKRPDPLAQLVERHRAALDEGRRRLGPHAVLIGKSMGGRVGCHLALEEEVLGVVCLGYPLVGMSKSAPLRDRVLLDLKCPALFVQGTRDTLCPLPLLTEILARRSALSELTVVESGDHSLVPTKTYLKQNHLHAEDIEQQVISAIRRFTQGL